MKKTTVTASVVLAAAALALTGCSAQLSTKDTCAQFLSVQKTAAVAGDGPSSAQVKAVAGQMGELAQKASDDTKGDLATVASGLQAYADGDKTGGGSRFNDALDHLRTVCPS